MKKCFAKILLLAICLFVVSAPLHAYAQENANANSPQQGSSGGSFFDKWVTDIGVKVAGTAGTYVGAGGGVSGGIAVVKNSGPVKAGLEMGGEAIRYVVDKIVRTAGFSITSVAALILMVSGEAFDFVLGATVTGEGLFNIIQPSILLCWRIVRDVSNIIIVFSLLYLAIKTIIDGNGFADKKVLAGVLVAALFINFSLFFTKFVYQVSNEVGTAIVGEIKLGGEGLGSFSTGVMQIFGLQALFVKNIFPDNNDWSGMWSTLNSSILTSLMFIGLSVIFFVFSFVLVKRFFIFVLLMISSPLGLISFFIPWLDGVKKSWWGQLKGQALYLPAFFITLYISMSLMSNIIGTLGPQAVANMSSVRLDTASSINSELGAIAVSGINVFIYTLFAYILCIGCLLLPILLPNRIASAGAGAMNNFGSWATGKVRGMPGMAGRFAGRTAMGAAARAGRANAGRRANNLLYGKGYKNKSEEDRKNHLKDLQLRARNGDSTALSALGKADKLRERTYDLRNVKALGLDKKFGKGIQNWNGAVEDKKKKMEAERKKEMKRLGYDGMARDNQHAIVAAERERDIETDKLKVAKETLKLNDNTVNRQAVIDAQKALETVEKKVGEQKNKGEAEYLEVMRRQQARLGNRMSASQREAFKKMEEDMRKRWHEDGKAKKTTQRRTPPPPGPTPPPPTP